MEIIRKKLLQINVTANWGSTGKIAEQIGLKAMESGWDSYIAYGRMMNPSKSNLIKIGTQWDVYCHYALSKFFDMEGLASKRATRKLVKEIERIEPSVVHLHNIHDHYLNYPILFEYLSVHNIPVVWTQHDQWGTTGHCAYNMEGCEKWKTGCYDCPLASKWSLDKSKRNYELKKKWFTTIKKAIIVPVSDWLRNELEQSFLSKYPIHVIKNGIDIDVFKPKVFDIREKYGIGGKKIILSVASVWSDGKGIADFIRLEEKLPKEWVIVMVGKIDSKNLPEGIINIHQTQDQIELAEVYSAANVYVSLSSSETFGLTIAEAMACGTPAIVYDNTAQPELVTPQTGEVVRQGDIDGILNALQRFEIKSVRMSDLCREHAVKFLDKNKSYSSYISLYNKLSGGGKKVILGVAFPWSERKGLKDFVRLQKLLPENYLIVLVGVSSEQQEVLPDGIIGIQRTQNQRELAQMYSMADVFLNLTYQDNYPTTNLEAMACGTPVITYRTGGSPESVDEETGAVVEQGDIEAVASEIKRLTNLEKDNLSIACRKKALKLFDAKNAFAQYISLYNKLAEG